MTLALLASTALVAVAASPAAAQTFADWSTAPASGDVNTAGNWMQGFVPTDGFFQNSSITALTNASASPATFNQFHFQTGATAYTLTISTGFIFAGVGIVVDANTGTFTVANQGVLTFQNASTIANNNTAGSVVINNMSCTRFG